MDSVRSKFLWRGDETKFKYHMVRWENVCFPKDYSGLGVINTRRMNEALLTKWIWRILENRENDPCVQLLRRKYLASKSFVTSTARRGRGPNSSKDFKKSNTFSTEGRLLW